MVELGFIALGALSQAICSNLMRHMQARCKDFYTAVVSNYGAALVGAVAYCLSQGAPEAWIKTLALGLNTGFFYTAALIAIIRSMGQRGLAMTVAIVNVSQLIPALIAIFLGERPGRFQVPGMLVAAAAIPFLSLATATGREIRETPNLRLLGLMFVFQGSAMSGNLFAFKWLPASSIPFYLVALFGFGLGFGVLAWSVFGRTVTRADLGRGAVFGVFNLASTIIILIALVRVPGHIFFAGMSVLGLALNVAAALVLWRERLQRRGWLGLSLAVVATLLLNLH